MAVGMGIIVQEEAEKAAQAAPLGMDRVQALHFANDFWARSKRRPQILPAEALDILVPLYYLTFGEVYARRECEARIEA